MLETVSIPIMVKAINFLFEECSKILKERRERRLKETPQPVTPPATSPEPPEDQQAIQTREVALETKIPQTTWLDAESRVEHLTNLLEIHLRNYQQVSKQYAMWGEALVPPIIANNLFNEEKEIAKITSELQTLLSKVYEKKLEAIPNEQIDD